MRLLRPPHCAPQKLTRPSPQAVSADSPTVIPTRRATLNVAAADASRPAPPWLTAAVDKGAINSLEPKSSQTEAEPEKRLRRLRSPRAHQSQPGAGGHESHGGQRQAPPSADHAAEKRTLGRGSAQSGASTGSTFGRRRSRARCGVEWNVDHRDDQRHTKNDAPVSAARKPRVSGAAEDRGAGRRSVTRTRRILPRRSRPGLPAQDGRRRHR